MNRSETKTPPDAADRALVVTRGPAVAVAWLALLAALMVAVLAPFGDFHWAIDLFNHLRLHALLAALLALVLAAVKRRRVLAAAAVVLVAVHGWVIAPWQLYRFSAAEAVSENATVGLLIWNIHDETEDGRPLLRLVDRYDPDIVAVIEFSDELGTSESMRTLRKRYPLSMELPGNSAHGIAAFARRGVSFERIEMPGGPPAVTVLQRQPDGGEVRYWFIHPPSPTRERDWRARGRYFERLAELIQGTREYQHVVAGDFNLTPWTDDFRRLTDVVQLKDSRHGHGMDASWPRSLRVLGIPIDHVLVPPAWRVLRREVDYLPPSDHASVFVELLPQ